MNHKIYRRSAGIAARVEMQMVDQLIKIPAMLVGSKYVPSLKRNIFEIRTTFLFLETNKT